MYSGGGIAQKQIILHRKIGILFVLATRQKSSSYARRNSSILLAMALLTYKIFVFREINDFFCFDCMRFMKPFWAW